ncbi:vitamin B12 dependent-methionine synthase activation domain-containing protein [Aeromicrobium sp. CnD17-E]|uniref:vitamin B12 dependent-methionine synthase activation domain-containing protein n=1 Tax=Aeromicrobium sp. CnD17-E TaxID=2954487 RepID=UPI0035ABA350
MVGIFPANGRGDDTVVFADEAREESVAVLHHLRQQTEHRKGVNREHANACTLWNVWSGRPASSQGSRLVCTPSPA